MNTKTLFLGIVILILLGVTVSSTELIFLEEVCLIGGDCTLNDLFVTGNLTFVGTIINVTILNQNVTGELSIGGSLNVNGNITSDFIIADGSLLSNIPNSSLWNRSGTNVFFTIRFTSF